jgi:hypothetical protein
MKTLDFAIGIHAPKEKVWETLWNDVTYKKWTAPFGEGSYMVSDLKEGSKALFLDPKKNGMHSIVDKNIPNKLMAFKHMGEMKNGKEVSPDEKSKSWAGAMEIYKLNEANGITTLIVEMDVIENMEKFFMDSFPKALEVVKEISEK